MEREEERKGAGRASTGPAHSTQRSNFVPKFQAPAATGTQSSSAPRDPNAMEIDRVEVERRRAAGECFRCGQKGHISRFCPTKRQRVAAVGASSAEPSSGTPTATITEVPTPVPMPTTNPSTMPRASSVPPPPEALTQLQQQVAALAEQLQKLQQGFF